MKLETGAEGAARRWGGRSQAIALGVILLVAIVARAVGLNASLWYDEVVTLVQYVRLPFAELIATYDSLNNHMFYSILAQFSANLFGEAAWSVRLPAVLFGVLSIPVHWQIARRYVGPGEALVVALLLAISYHHIWFSQNARGYTMLLFFTSASVLCFLNGFERGSRGAWIGFALAAAAAIYTHLTALFFYAALGLVYLFVLGQASMQGGSAEPQRKVPVAAPILAGIAAIILALLLNLPIIGSVVGTVAAVSEETANSGQALAEWQNPLRAVAEVGRSLVALGPLIPLVLAGALVTIATGVVALARRVPLLVAIYLLQIPVTIAILSLLDMRIWPRFFFNEIGIFYLFAVHGTMVIVAWASGPIGRYSGWKGALPLLTGAAVVAMVIVSAGLLPRYYAYPKQPFETARDYVESARGPQDQVGAIGLAGFAYDTYHRPGWRVAENVGALRALEEAPGRTWILIAFPTQTTNGQPELMRELGQRYERVRKFPGTLGDGAIWVYRSHR